jgi:diguanylate cyclase (GGDEF)-like protein/PAS domain S-box-containing protein
MSSRRTSSNTSSDTWLRAVVECLRDVVWVHDIDGTITYCSPAASAVLGYSPSELHNTNEADLIHPFDLAARNATLEQLVATNEPQPPVDMRLRNRDGSFGWFEITDSDLLGDPAVDAIVTTARDISVRKAAAEELIDVSMHDSLTGLPNRMVLTDRLEIALARTARSNSVLAVMFCDLDEFKVVNDTLGHEIGDQVLKEVGRRLKSLRRKSDTVARSGGDEFVVVCDGLTGLRDATDIAAQVRDAVEQPFDLDETSTSVSVSIGIVTVQGVAAKGMEPSTLLRNADAAMYRAKVQGKARWHVFDDTLIEEGTHRTELESELRPALERREFVLHYQPIFDLGGRRIVGSEALIRWNHPTRGLLFPGQFIAVAEQTGLIVSIGEWVLSEACAQLRRWQQEFDSPEWISVNLSVRQVVEPALAETVSAIVSAAHLEPNCLWLNLSETALMRAGHSASVELAAVAALGVHVGMDDFGAGTASPANLQHLPIDFLRIGQSFVANMDGEAPADEGGNAIVHALTDIGRGLKLCTVADGIRRDEELLLMREFGCDYGQGNLFARPLTGEDFTRLLAHPGVDPVPLQDHATSIM